MVSRIGIGPPPHEVMIEMQAPLLPQGDASHSELDEVPAPISLLTSPLERTARDVRVSIAEHLTVQELSFFYRLSHTLRRAFPSELTRLPRFHQTFSPLMREALERLDPFFQEKYGEARRTDEFGRQLLSLRQQLVRDVAMAKLMAREREHALFLPHRLGSFDVGRMWGRPELLELIRRIFYRQQEARTLLDRPQDRLPWRLRCLSPIGPTFMDPLGGGLCCGCTSLIGMISGFFVVLCCNPFSFTPALSLCVGSSYGLGAGCTLSCCFHSVTLPVLYRTRREHMGTVARMESLRQLWLGALLHLAESLPEVFPEEYREQVQLYRRVRDWFLSEERAVIWESFRELRVVRFWREMHAFPSAFNPFYEGGNLGLKYLALINALEQVIKIVCEEHDIPRRSYPTRLRGSSQNLIEACQGDDVDRVREVLIEEQIDLNHPSCRGLFNRLLWERKEEMARLFIQAGFDCDPQEFHLPTETFWLFLRAGLFVDDPTLVANLDHLKRYDFGLMLFLCGIRTRGVEVFPLVFSKYLAINEGIFTIVREESVREIYAELPAGDREALQQAELETVPPDLYLPIYQRCLSKIFERNFLQIPLPGGYENLPEDERVELRSNRFHTWLIGHSLLIVNMENLYYP